MLFKELRSPRRAFNCMWEVCLGFNLNSSETPCGISFLCFCFVCSVFLCFRLDICSRLLRKIRAWCACSFFLFLNSPSIMATITEVLPKLFDLPFLQLCIFCFRLRNSLWDFKIIFPFFLHYMNML